MRYQVSDECIGCGMCESLCPDVFHLKRNFKAEAIADDVEDENAEDAMASCPAGAISQMEE